MQFTSTFFFLFLSIHTSSSFTTIPSRTLAKTALSATPQPWQDDDLTEAVQTAVEQAIELEKEQQVPIRFINFDRTNPLQQTVVYAPKGKNLLKLADETGIRIPRQCRSGLCGSCTADIKDPTWKEGDRPGFQTIRTCQAGAMIPAGCDEMVVDLYRMIEAPSGSYGEVTAGGKGAKEASLNVSTGGPTMTNFEDGWENQFVPDYKSGGKIVRSSSPAPAYTVGHQSTYSGAGPGKKLKRWFPKSSDNIAPWDIVW